MKRAAEDELEREEAVKKLKSGELVLKNRSKKNILRDARPPLNRSALSHLQNVMGDVVTRPLIDAAVLQIREIKKNSKMIQIDAEELKKGRALPPSFDPTNPNQDFSIWFMNMGTGDCIVILTPEGRALVVDCGQSAKPRGVNGEAAEKKWKEDIEKFLADLIKGKIFECVIFTHPDKDHYCLAGRLLFSHNDFKPNFVFHSMEKEKYELGEASGSAVYSFFKKATGCLQVSINDQASKINGNIENVEKLYPFAKDGSLPILTEKNCSVTLLAAGVSNTRGATKVGEVKNAASVVTLVEVYGRKILLTGDATHPTEDFLVEKRKARIPKIDLLQMGHHGSGTEHAGKDFVELVNPYVAVASSGPYEGHNNPRWSTIARYAKHVDEKECWVDPSVAHRLSTEVDEHRLRYGIDGHSWAEATAKVNRWTGGYLKYAVYTTDSNEGHLCFVVDKAGNLTRKWQRSDGEYSVSIAKDGRVSESKPSVGTGVRS